jgi:glycine oxidase
MQICEVAIAGAGIIGCAVARALGHIGLRVTLIERALVGGEASAAAAGMLGAEGETENEIVLSLGRESRRLFPDELAALRAETNISVESWREGTLYLCFGAADVERVTGRVRALGVAALPLEPRRARALEPALSSRVRSAFLFAEDTRVDNARLTAAYAGAARNAGCTIRERERVTRVVTASGRVAGVETDRGGVACDVFVNAAGAWAGTLAAGLPIPVAPVRGQMVAVDAGRPPFRHAIYSCRGYAVSRRDGRVLLGSTRERVGFDRRATAGGIRRILAAGVELAPGLGKAPVRQWWAGLRPATPDGLPIIGFDPAVSGYLVATGHYRNGILLAPITARLVADLLQGRDDPLLAPLRLDRFQAKGAAACPVSAEIRPR